MASIQRQIHTAIITGPTGAIGMALCAKLLAEGVTVYAVTHPGSARAALLPQDARLHVVPCDAAELAALPELIPEKADAFFHFAWAHTIGPGRNDMPAQIENIRYTMRPPRRGAAGLPGLYRSRQPGRVWPRGGRADRADPLLPGERLRYG